MLEATALLIGTTDKDLCLPTIVQKKVSLLLLLLLLLLRLRRVHRPLTGLRHLRPALLFCLDPVCRGRKGGGGKKQERGSGGEMS